MKHPYKFGVLLALALVLGGCGLFGKKDSSTTTGATTGTTDDSSTSRYGNEGNGAPVQIGDGGMATPLGGTGSTGNVVYFEFDSIAITDSGRDVVAAAGQYLASHPSARARLEGHADERGTREYNVGLGERRANAVAQALQNAGASASQLSVVSYGEERPASPGHDDSAWALNRRVEIVK